MPFVELSNVRLFYTDEGDGPPVLMVHGWSCDGSDWSWQTPALLAAGYRCIVPDLRGHGRSSVPAQGFAPKDYADDLAELVGHLKADPVVAIGHSMGGATVVALAVEHPEVVRALVPVDSAYGMAEGAGEMATQLGQAFRSPAGHAAALQFASSTFYTPATPAHLPPLHARRIAAFDQEVMAQAMEALLSKDSFGEKSRSEAYLRRIAVPALAFRAGRQDPSAVAQWERENFRHPKSRALSWEGTGHWLHQERPAEFNAILLEWLASLDEK
ncbi:MAG: alpha/beta fold hydrolase [Dehalococcoidia bacterium]